MPAAGLLQSRFSEPELALSARSQAARKAGLAVFSLDRPRSVRDRDHHQETTMIKTLSAALLAVSMLAAPAFAASVKTDTAPVAKPAAISATTAKARAELAPRHVKKHVAHRHHHRVVRAHAHKHVAIHGQRHFVRHHGKHHAGKNLSMRSIHPSPAKRG
jgi:hypothetical protein